MVHSFDPEGSWMAIRSTLPEYTLLLVVEEADQRKNG
jgi:hypothetical protein